MAPKNPTVSYAPRQVDLIRGILKKAFVVAMVMRRSTATLPKTIRSLLRITFTFSR
jgi:hypothetical protein